MATMNTSSQTNSEYGHTKSVNYYQVFLKKGNQILLGSQIYSDFEQIKTLIADIQSNESHHIVSYVSAVPNLGLLNHNLQRNYRTSTGSYEFRPNPDPELNSSQDPEVSQTNSVEQTPKQVSFSTPKREPYNSSPPPCGRFKTYSMNFTKSPSPSPEPAEVSASAPVSPLPNNSYFSTDPSLEVRGRGIKRQSSSEDLWEHLAGEQDNMTESFVEDGEEPQIFGGMTLEEYGKGFLLRPPHDHPDCGTKYYHNAWWRADLGAWFMKEEHLDYFLDNGALWKLEDASIDALLEELEDDDEETTSRLFYDMVFEPYGPDGYLLQCYNTHPDYKKKFYHGGTWHRQGDGWFFPSEYKEFLEDNGASYECDEETLFKGMDFYPGTKRGQFYLSPSLESRFYGLSVFEVGSVSAEWCHQMESWRFEGVNDKFFTDRGAGRTSWH
tara:strand:+ start:192 stop:1508 length:1317 start_codon:yes stop_codon:yes gene_type:complete